MHQDAFVEEDIRAMSLQRCAVLPEFVFSNTLWGSAVLCHALITAVARWPKSIPSA